MVPTNILGLSMGKGHRDNHAARVKRGTVAFQKKAQRRAYTPKCQICGTVCRASVLNENGICPKCVSRLSEPVEAG